MHGIMVGCISCCNDKTVPFRTVKGRAWTADGNFIYLCSKIFYRRFKKSIVSHFSRNQIYWSNIVVVKTSLCKCNIAANNKRTYSNMITVFLFGF